jgi:hypothetical protein
MEMPRSWHCSFLQPVLFSWIFATKSSHLAVSSTLCRYPAEDQGSWAHPPPLASGS